MGIIIAGFATCGKSILGKKYNNIKDLESSPYKNIFEFRYFTNFFLKL